MSDSPHAAAITAAVLDVVKRNVRLAFGIGADAFAGRVVSLVGDQQTAAAAAAAAARLSLQDLYLAVSCAAGDDHAWREFVRTHRSFMVDFARRIVGDADAPDLADRVIADLWERRKLAQYEGRSTLRTWLGAVVGHAGLNERRRQSSFPKPVLQAALTDPALPRDHLADAENAERLQTVIVAALGQLPAEDRLLVLMHYEQGLTLDQASVVLGASKSTLSRRLARVRRTVLDSAERLALEQYGSAASELWRELDPERLDFDLRAACADRSWNTVAARVSKEQVKDERR
ncbi:MAG: RNA polymerase sigma factor [Betaproteobacteria bacterium]